MNERKGSVSAVVITILCLLAIFGYLNNIAKLCKCDFEAPLKAEFIRGTGIFIFPVGIITGFMDIDDAPKETNLTTQP